MINRTITETTEEFDGKGNLTRRTVTETHEEGDEGCNIYNSYYGQCECAEPMDEADVASADIEVEVTISEEDIEKAVEGAAAKVAMKLAGELTKAFEGLITAFEGFKIAT